METSMICTLPDDLLLRILYYVPTKDAVATSILSQQWCYVWTMLPRLKFKDKGISESVGCFIDKSLQLHKARRLDSLTVEIGPHYPVDVDVGDWVENAVNRGVEELKFKLLWIAEPTRFPKSIYTCETLVELTLSNQILVDVSFPARLPSLEHLTLDYVVYKDEDSLDRLLSSSNVLECLTVNRLESDNLKTFTVKVSSLETLDYTSIRHKDEVEVGNIDEEYEDEVEEENEVDEEDVDDLIESLIIDSPALRELNLWNLREKYCLIENMFCLDKAFISYVFNPDVKFLRSLSSVIHLQLFLTESVFPRLIEFCLKPFSPVDWVEPLMFFLQNSPKLKTLMIYDICGSIIPECLSNHLEVFRWKDYRGREGEKQLLTYILLNSKCLKTIEISFKATCNLEESRKDLESMPRISTSSRLLFCSSYEIKV